MAYTIECVPNQAGKPAVLLREAWREGKRIRKRTVANLSRLPPHVVDGFRTVLKGGVAVQDPRDLLDITRSLPHGHAVAVLGTARKLGLDRILHRRRSRWRKRQSGRLTRGTPASSVAPIHGDCTDDRQEIRAAKHKAAHAAPEPACVV